MEDIRNASQATIPASTSIPRWNFRRYVPRKRGKNKSRARSGEIYLRERISSFVTRILSLRPEMSKSRYKYLATININRFNFYFYPFKILKNDTRVSPSFHSSIHPLIVSSTIENWIETKKFSRPYITKRDSKQIERKLYISDKIRQAPFRVVW